ncbi:MAG: hypothetical protein V1853_01350 [bacterium]
MNQYLNIKSIALLSLAGLLLAWPAQAYLDPGSGSFITQVVVATILGSLVALKVFFHRIKNFFSRLFSRIKR